MGVDLYAMQGGQPVEDLRADEIELLEDGVPQQIEAFEHVRIRPSNVRALKCEPAVDTARSRPKRQKHCGPRGPHPPAVPPRRCR